MKRRERGFTLVEVMIVVAIIAILAAIVVPNLQRARIQSNEASAQASLKLISNALENYAAINTDYPTSTAPLIGAAPPYLAIDYFTGIHNGYTFNATLTNYTYDVSAVPVNNSLGTKSFTITTGAVLVEN